MKNKYLQVRKDNVFTKFVNFIKGIFGKKVEQEVSEQVERVENKTVELSSSDEVKSTKEENTKMIELQNKYENGELGLEMLSDEEIDELDLLYKVQVMDLKKILEDKKTQLAVMKNRNQNSR